MNFISNVNVDSVILELIDKMKDHIHVEAGSPEGTVKQSKNLFEAMLPEGITMDIVKQVHDYEQKYSLALMLAITDIAGPLFAETPEMKKLQASFPTVAGDLFYGGVTRNKISNQTKENIVDLSSIAMMSFIEHEGHFTVVKDN